MRLTQIAPYDLRLFDFDYDLTFMVFFLDGRQRILGRYGARNADDAESLQSLEGLRYAMSEALRLHRRLERDDDPPTAPSEPQHRQPLLIRNLPAARDKRGCIHCHDVSEILRADAQARGVWKQSDLFRFPPTDNLGISLEVDRGNQVRRITADSPAAHAGLQPGDLIESLHGMRVRSIADARYALDRAPAQGEIGITWRRQGRLFERRLQLPTGWRRSDISWRPSMQQFVALPRLYGTDLSLSERIDLGLTPDQLAFRHRQKIHRQAQPAGVRPGDIILGFDGKVLNLDVYDFEKYVRRHYVAGDRVMIDLIRDGRRLRLPMTILPLY